MTGPKATLRGLKSTTGTGKHAHLLLMDIANPKSIKAAAEEFSNEETQISILFNL
ncbi:hypothetical protein BU15DRAFT_75922 [Melanogaster broomeanus]|nr:hypothetical protein BU15DRAFT_75922 [Melanogaster broomeanus]